MKHVIWLALALLLLSCAAPQPPTSFYTLLENGNVHSLPIVSGETPASLAARAGLNIRPADRFYFNGQFISADFALPPEALTLQLRRAIPVTLLSPGNASQTFDSAAQTVGEALLEAGITLGAADFVSPPPQTPITAPVTVTYRPARELVISVDNATITVKTAAATVGQALASAGIPLFGLDTSFPPEAAPLPQNGQVKIVRVQEKVTVQEKSIPFSTEFRPTEEMNIGTQNVLSFGEAGLAVSRVRIRYEDGVEASRITEAETVVRQPVAQVVGYGTKVSLTPIDAGGGALKYWHSMQMYATWYSPCHSGTNGCSYGTASGLPVKRGVVAMVRQLYYALGGGQVYVPGYGVATIGDIGGGFPDGRPWIDLAYAEDDPGERMSGWVTVYFLAPAPATIPDLLLQP
jgi:uncharacterized protein YabE (DUF348 family)